MKRLKKFLSLFLVVVMVFSVVPVGKLTVRANSSVTLESLQKKYPHGKYWNGGNADSYTSNPCTHHGSCSYSGTCGCNSFKGHAIQCMGFAYQLAYLIYGGDPYTDWTVNRNVSSLNSLKAGDVVRYKNDGHSIFVVGVSGDTVSYADCNSDGQCKIRWGQTISKSTLKSTFTYVDSAPYEWEGGGHTHSYTEEWEATHPHRIYKKCYSCGDYYYTGETKTLSSCSSCNSKSYVVTVWASTKGQGYQHNECSEVTNGTVGNAYYIWYKLYDKNSGALYNENTNYTATVSIYNPDDSLLFSYRYNNSSANWIKVTPTKIGSYRMNITLTGDITADFDRYFNVSCDGKVSFNKSSMALTIPTKKTGTLSVSLSGDWPDNAGYTFDYDSNFISYTQDGSILSITAKKTGTTYFTIFIVDKNNNNRIASATCEITISNATYTVKYDANGGTGKPSNQIKTYGETLRISSVESKRSGYEFLGWSRNKNSTAPEYLPGDSFSINADTTLYAVWRQITLISINANSPDKATYFMGESLDTSGLKVRLEYSDGSSSTITSGYTVSGFDSSIEGSKTVTVSYGGKTDKFEVHVIAPSVSLSETSLTMNVGEINTLYAKANPSDGDIKWSVSDSNVITVANGRITAVGIGTAMVRVTFSYNGYYSFASCEVTVKATKTISSISVSNMPTKNVYEIGEELDTSGLKLKLTWSDGTITTTSIGYTTSGFSSVTAGIKTVMVSCGGKTTTFNVTVKDPAVDENAPQVVVEHKNAKVGEKVLVTINLKNNPGIWGMDLVVNYDKTQLTLTSVTNGTVFSSSEWTQGNLSGEKYILSYEASGFDNITTNGVLATLEFTVNENATVDSFTSVSLSYNVGDIINVSFDDINVGIVSGGINITDFVYGDLNSDGLVNKKDSLLMKMYLADNSTTIDMQAADVYVDGSINKKDSLYLKQYLAGLDVELGA